MQHYRQSKWSRVLTGLVAAALGASWAVGAVRSVRDKYEVAKMTEKMKTVCVGRLLIDLPKKAQVGLNGPTISSFHIDAFDESDEAFTARVAAREAEIRATPDHLGGNRNMESVREVKTDSGLVGKIFVHGRVITEGTSGSSPDTMEHYHYENVAVEGYVHADGISVDLTAEKYDPDHVDNLSRLISQLVPNPANRIPTEPGFCIDKAYFRDPLTADQRENIFMSARLPSHPDLTIGIISMAGNEPVKRGLIERSDAAWSKGPLAMAIKLRLTKLRAAPRTFGGLTGDELIVRVYEENFSTVFGFQWEVLGKKDDVFVPHLLLEMSTGRGKKEPVQSSLSQDAAIALWDKITSSIRLLRPIQPPKVSAIGAQAWAGDTCPHSGWWQCGDGGDGFRVLGGQRQYIKQGERMPQALLLPPQTLWQKIRRVQPSFETKTPTPWKLADKRSSERVAPSVPLAQATVAAPAATTARAAGMAEQPVPVGSLATTGTPCPVSGWWRCEESQALDGTRWFAQGSLLPAATFTSPSTVFGGSTVAPKTIQRSGTWQLVRYAQAPTSGPVKSGNEAG